MKLFFGRRARPWRSALRVVVATALTAIAIPVLGGGGTASASTLVCTGSRIPQGYVITEVLWTPSCNQSSPQFNAFGISPVHPVAMYMCNISRVPSGYVITGMYWSPICGKTHPYPNQLYIQRL